MKTLTPNWPAPKNITAFTTLRDTDYLNLPNLPTQPHWLMQVHSKNVAHLDQNTPVKPIADAAFTMQQNKICAILTADCLPILICDKQGTQVAAIHAGWRSLAAGVIAETCAKFSTPLQQCLAWLGPAIGPQKFEVGPDVIENFLSHGWQQQHIDQTFLPKPDTPQKWFANLYDLARITLQEHGFSADSIYGGELCTYSDPARFYSYRRSKDIGRMASLIYIR